MIINSPVGRFPFEVSALERRGHVVVLSGEMGNWPTSVEVSAGDLPAILKLVRPVLVAAAAIAGLVWWIARR